MQILKLKKREVPFKEFIKRPAKESDYTTLIRGDTIIYEEGKERPVLLYFKFQDDTSGVLKACQEIPYNTSVRSGGLKTTSAIFGFDPATGIRKPFCSATSLAVKHPKEHKVIVEFAKKISEIYQEYLPDTFGDHLVLAQDKIKHQWMIRGTPFTSGIINQNNQLNYHFDSGNFEGVYSNMIVFKNNVSGGYLSLPEYDCGLEVADNTLVMFDGQSILHGVTPISFFNDNAYRYSIVYYTLQSMWKCNDITGELAKIRERRLKTERANVNRKIIPK